MTRATNRRRLTIITCLEIKIVVYTHLNQINPSKKETASPGIMGWIQNGRKKEQKIFVHRFNGKLGNFLLCGFFLPKNKSKFCRLERAGALCTGEKIHFPSSICQILLEGDIAWGLSLHKDQS